MLANTEPLAGINGAANSGEQESLLTQHVKEREERKRSALLSRQSAQSRDSRRRGESRSSSRGGALLIAQSKGYLASQVIQPLLVATGESVFFHHGQSCPSLWPILLLYVKYIVDWYCNVFTLLVVQQQWGKSLNWTLRTAARCTNAPCNKRIAKVSTLVHTFHHVQYFPSLHQHGWCKNT